MFTPAHNSLCFDVSHPHRGMAHQGISPKGPSDRLSFAAGFILLGEPEEFKAIEVIHSRSIDFDEESLFVLTGASCHYMQLQKTKGKKLPLSAGQVYKADAGDRLLLAPFTKGSKLYLIGTSLNARNRSREGLQRGPFRQWFPVPSPTMRFFKGPEFDYLKDDFFQYRWKISRHSDLMGLRLEGEKLLSDRYDIISSAVDDGCVQLSENGPILLMRHRQTIGGYPRILQLCSVDINTLAQYPLNAVFKPEAISFKQAQELLEEQEKALEHFRRSFI